MSVSRFRHWLGGVQATEEGAARQSLPQASAVYAGPAGPVKYDPTNGTFVAHGEAHGRRSSRSDLLEAIPVGPLVNSARNQGRELIEAVGAALVA